MSAVIPRVSVVRVCDDQTREHSAGRGRTRAVGPTGLRGQPPVALMFSQLTSVEAPCGYSGYGAPRGGNGRRLRQGGCV